MSDFKRESRYIVLKLSDVEKALDDRQKGLLEGLSLVVESHRISSGKAPLNAVVVESDWPFYETVWKQVEAMAQQDKLLRSAKPDWSKAPPQAKFWAVDFDGLACWFKSKPDPWCGRWCYNVGYSPKGDHWHDQKFTVDPKSGFKHWEQTLHERPEAEAHHE